MADDFKYDVFLSHSGPRPQQENSVPTRLAAAIQLEKPRVLSTVGRCAVEAAFRSSPAATPVSSKSLLAPPDLCCEHLEPSSPGLPAFRREKREIDSS